MMKVIKIDDVNMISIKDTKELILETLSRCTKGSDVYNTYKAVLDMLTAVSDDYDAEVFADCIIDKYFKN